MPKKDTNAERMSGHAARTGRGTLRRIRNDTLMGTLENRYKTDFGVRKDMKWETYKRETGVDSVKEALDKSKR